MSQFITDLCLKLHNNKDDGVWDVLSPLIYQSDIAKTTFTVPVGFVTDLASVPEVPVIFDLVGGKANKASVVHDYLCVKSTLPRSLIDLVFLEAASVSGVPAWRRNLMYFGIRLHAAAKFIKQLWS